MSQSHNRPGRVCIVVRNHGKEPLMDQLQARIDLLGRSLALLATYALVIGGLSLITNLPDAAGGEDPALGRAILGTWGVAAGLLVWTLRNVGIDGWRTLMIWSVAQVLIIAWSSDGSPTVQMFDFLLGVTSSMTVNGVQTSFEQYGVNVVGIILVAVMARTRDRWNHRVKPLIADESATAVGTT